MAQQTAVDWLIEQLQAPCRGIPSHIIHKAKEMEEQQREKLAFEYFKAGQDSMEEGGKSFEQYYNKTKTEITCQDASVVKEKKN